MEGHGGRQTFLLNARKVMSARTSNYRISSIKNDFSKTEKGYRGKLRANFVGTMFTSYSKGLKPDENKNVEGGGDLRKEYVTILYVSFFFEKKTFSFLKL